MICFVITWPRETLVQLHQIPGMPRHAIWSYDRLLKARRLPRATWIFTDFDRLGAWDLELAARVCRVLQQAGMQVLNDPAQAMHRFALLRSLHARGLNRFQVWRPHEQAAVDRWPVFLRTETAHRGPLTDLIHDAAGLRAALAQARAQGHPERDLMVVEYCAQPLRPGLFRKYAAYRVGERLVRALSVHDTQWVAQQGQSGCADVADYQDELEHIDSPPGEPVLRAAFEVSRLQYGRIDYALVDGQVQVYEINSNPFIAILREHAVAARVQAARAVDDGLAQAFQAIDAPPGPAVPVRDALLVQQRRHDRFMWRSRWMI
ncbi:hypothetical protein [Castellaniella sp.]|uniref:hypothetical protein n=1 Tax=Castellaniella sp. TaxID=1955812 RepID=UPI00355E8775